MSNYVPEILSYALTVSKNFDSYDPQANLFSSAAASFAYDGPLSPMQPITELSADKIGYKAPTWGTDLFDKIFVNFPIIGPIGIGDVIADFEYSFYIWNTYGIVKTCVDFDATGTVGISIDGPETPFVINPYKVAEYTVTFTMMGPSTIDAKYDWDFLESYDTDLNFIGNRVLLLKMLHNWKEPLSLTLKAETVVSSTKKLYEQRKALYSELRREFTTTGTLVDPLLRNRLTAIANSYFGWPIFIEAITPELGQGSIEGLMSFNVVDDLDSYWHIHNVGKMIVWNDELGDCEALGIASVESDKINIVYPSLRTWDLDVCTLYPMLRCTISSLNIVHHTDKVYDVKLTLSEFLDEYGR